MRIDSVRLFRVPLGTAEARDGARLESVYVCLHSDGHCGFGEVTLAAAPVNSVEWAAGAFCCLRDWLAPAVIGQSVDSGEVLHDMLAPFQGNHAAKSALDIAWWTLAAELRGVSLHQLLRGARTAIPVSHMLGPTGDVGQLLREITDALASGCDHVTLKLRPGWDIETLRAVRQTFPAVPIAVDCDGRYTLGQQEMFYRMEDFFLEYIEQPLPADDLVGHAMLQDSLRTPIALDQSVTTLARVEQAIDLGSCRLARIDLAQVAGLTPALDIHRVCCAAKIPCSVSAAARSSIAAAATAAFACVCEGPMTVESHNSPMQPWIAPNSTIRPETCADGKLAIRLPEGGAGPGFTIDVDGMAAAAIEQATLD